MFSTVLYAQDELNIQPGVRYKFILFDDTQIIGKVISVDKGFVKIQTKDKNVVSISKDYILFVTTDLTPEKYESSFALTGGISFLNDDRYYYSRESQPGPHINLSGMFYLSGTKAVKVDLSYSYAKPKYEETYYYSYGGEAPEPDKFEGGEGTYISLKPSFVLGQLRPENKTMAYGYIGLGVNYFHKEDLLHTYYYRDYKDTTYTVRTDKMTGRSGLGAVLGFGGGLGFRITPKLSILTEIEFNILTLWEDFRSYIPLRIGINYLVY